MSEVRSRPGRIGERVGKEGDGCREEWGFVSEQGLEKVFRYLWRSLGENGEPYSCLSERYDETPADASSTIAPVIEMTYFAYASAFNATIGGAFQFGLLPQSSVLLSLRYRMGSTERMTYRRGRVHILSNNPAVRSESASFPPPPPSY